MTTFWRDVPLRTGVKYRFITPWPTHGPTVPGRGPWATIGRLMAREYQGGVEVFVLDVGVGFPAPILVESVLDIQDVAADAQCVVLHEWKGEVRGRGQ